MEEVLVHDVIEEILEKLPPKSLLRFKSVSKQWKSTIESRVFQHKHFTHHRQKSKTPNLLSISVNKKFLFPTLVNIIITLELKSSITNNIPIPWEKNLFMVCENSIDGLVCLYDDYDLVVIFNPATRWYRTLPPSIYQQSLTIRQFSSLGFGKDQINGSYKPVWLYNSLVLNSANPTICEVFDFNINAWRFLEPSSPHRINYWYNPVYLNGLLYWLTEEKEEEITSVLSLDLHTETFEIVCKTPLRDIILYNLNDNLCGSANIGDNKVIWSLNLEEKTWKKLYNIDMLKICPIFQGYCWCAVSPLGFVGENNNKLMLFSYCDCLGFKKQRLMIYDHETTTSCHVLCTRRFINSVCYFQSLISIL